MQTIVRMHKKASQGSGVRAFFLATMLVIFAISAVSAAPLPAEQQQSREVSGRVTDQQNAPLVGVTVIVQGTDRVVMTNAEGNYTIQAASGETLEFNHVGYTQQAIAVTGPNLNVTMSEDVRTIEDVVVVGYGTQRRSEVTAAVASLKESNFNTTVAAASPLELAIGKIPGLNITNLNAADPRSEIDIQIRGTSSMRGSNRPLVVIDGVPYNDIMMLNMIPPEDITSFNVLKDASAAAIYGTRGSNGVILITTKRGSVNEDMRATFDYSVSMSHDYVYRMTEMLTAEEYLKYRSSGGPNSGAMVDNGSSTDWLGQLLNRNNFSNTHNLSMSGGSRRNNYRASIYYRSFDPISIESEAQSWGVRAGINHLGFNERLEVQLNLNTDFREQNQKMENGLWESAAQRNPTLPIFKDDGTYWDDTGFDGYNPVARLATKQDKQHRSATMLSALARLTIIDGLKVGVQASWTQNNSNRNRYWERGSKESMDSYRGGGRAIKGANKNITQVIEFTIDYSKVFNDIHSFNVIAGHSYEYEVREAFEAWNSGWMSDAFEDNSLGTGTGITSGSTSYANMSSSKYDSKLASFFGRVNYSLKNRYLFSATLRADGSSKFGANNRWGIFPAVSAGWIISQEEFMKNTGWIDNLKLRVGYGVTGNLPSDNATDRDQEPGLGASGNYAYLITMATQGQYPLSTGNWSPLYHPSRNPNPDLKWEEKREWNLGLDFSLLNNRLSGTLDVYRRMTVDIIDNYNAQVPSAIHTTITTNVGSMSNRGIELGLAGLIVEKKDFQYDATMTFTWQKNVLESLSNSQYKVTYREFQGLPSPGNLGNAFRSEEGHPTGQFYGKRFAGFNDQGQFLFYKKDGSTATSGGIVADDYAYIGNGTPKFQASMGHTFRYKNIDLSLLFRGKFGFDILNCKNMYYGNTNWLPNNVIKEAITKYAHINDNPAYSDYYLEKGDYVKLHSMTLGYTFNFKNRDWIRSLRVYGSWQNCFTITGYSGATPELRDSGFITGYDARSFYPVTSSIMFGINVGF